MCATKRPAAVVQAFGLRAGGALRGFEGLPSPGPKPLAPILAVNPLCPQRGSLSCGGLKLAPYLLETQDIKTPNPKPTKAQALKPKTINALLGPQDLGNFL